MPKPDCSYIPWGRKMPKQTIFFVLALAALLNQQARALQDPTRPTDPAAYFGSGTVNSGAWTLQSILSSPVRRIAIINGTRVREGDRIGSAKVVRISESQVVINTGGHALTLYLLPKSIKVRP